MRLRLLPALGARSTLDARNARMRILDALPGVRETRRRRLASFSPESAGTGWSREEREAELAPMISSVATLATLPFLQPPLRKALTFVNVGATLARGADTLVNHGIKVEVLDALAVGLATARGEVYTANLTSFLLALGEFLERRTERQSDRLLRKLLRPDPAMAWVERGGALVQVPGDQVREGETVVVGLGETIPVDGRVLEGVALVNQASVTGEDVPVRKEAPRRVVSGSVVMEGRIRLEATRVGDQTTTAQVSRFIRESLARRSDTQRLADKLADQRVYLTLGTGGLVYALTRDLTRLESVFLVDYSCALKLGTPVAFKSGMYRAARHGILMKGGDAIEHLAAVDTVAHGMSADMGGGRIVIGSRHYLEEHQGISFAAHGDLIERLEEQGKTLLYVAGERGPVGLIALRDTLRADADATLARLRALGVERLILITGDRRPKAEALAAELGLDEVHAEMRPEEKAGIIARLQASGRKVAFVGDGVNDGPALARAEVGIALPRGADIARATAGIVLLDDRLYGVAEAREVAVRTMALIRTNFNLAVGINTGVLAGAVLGWLSPVMSALLHNGTTIGILLHALSGVHLQSEGGRQSRPFTLPSV